MWPEPNLLRDKLYGSLEELRRTSVFVRASPSSVRQRRRSRLSGMLGRIITEVQDVGEEGQDLQSLLNCQIHFDFVFTLLSKVGLNRGHLLHEKEWARPAFFKTVIPELVIDTEIFRTKEKQPERFTWERIQVLSPEHCKASNSLLKKCQESDGVLQNSYEE